LLVVCRRALLLLALTMMAPLAVSCSPDGPALDAATPSAAGSPSATERTRLGKVKEACVLLPAETVTKVLGSSKGTVLESKEGPVDDSHGQPEYTCIYYGRGAAEALSFKVLVSPGQGGNANAIIENIAKAARVKTESVAGLGEAAVTYVAGNGIRALATSLSYQTQLRTLIFTAPAVVPKAKLIELARLVLVQV
jgi:hypothetical protein